MAIILGYIIWNITNFVMLFQAVMKEHHKISNIPKFRCEML